MAARLVPSGRTATMLSAGLLELPWRSRFLPYEVVGALLWSGLAARLGYFFGSTFADSFWLPLLVSLGIAGVVTVVAELVNRFRRSSSTEDRGTERGTGPGTVETHS